MKLLIRVVIVCICVTFQGKSRTYRLCSHVLYIICTLYLLDSFSFASVFCFFFKYVVTSIYIQTALLFFHFLTVKINK